MNADAQYIVVAIVIAIALAVAIKKAANAFRHSDTNPHCAGCPLAAQCDKSGTKSKQELENCKKCRYKVAQSRN